MVSPYTDIVVPVDGQAARAATFGIPVRSSILLLDSRITQAETEQQRVVKRGRRDTAKTGITTTETGVLRVDDIPVVSGYMYRISTSGANFDVTSGTIAADETFSMNCRAEFGGSAATTASTTIGKIRLPVNSVSQGPIVPMMVFYYATASGMLSVLLTGLRQSGACTYQVFADATTPLDLTIEYAGVDPGDTGVDL